ncbi:MAG TPA: exosortase V [Novosphingobium sp.]|nr:exosortase V [Novosphingobium sp.]
MPDLVLLAGCIAIAVPTLVRVALEGWSSEQGAHGPIVFVTGLWLIWRAWPRAAEVARRGRSGVVSILVALLLPAWFLARITAVIQLEGFLAYGLVLTAAYARFGGAALRRLLFPLFYLAFTFPMPNTVVDAVTLPMKIGISHFSAWFLALFGYPVGGQGVMLQIGQYQLLVAAACAGLNSIVSLSALSLLYVHLRYGDRLGLAIVFAALIVPIALLANFVRVLLLLLLTYHFGESVAQGYMHTFAGLVMFSVALVALGCCDLLLQRFARRGQRSFAAASA